MKNLRRSSGLVIGIIWLLLPSAVTFGSIEEETLELVMSKDDSVCSSLLTIVATYLSEDRNMASQGRALGLVAWVPVEFPGSGSMDGVPRKALVDINNDGNNELVIKDSGFMHGLMTDRLFIFPHDSNVLSKLRSGPGGFGPLYNTPNKLNFSERGYALKDLPLPIKEKLMKDLKRQLAEPLKKGLIKEEGLAPALTGGPGSVLRPFVWGKTVYTLVTNLHGDWISISKYISGSNLEDICYFHGPDRITPN